MIDDGGRFDTQARRQFSPHLAAVVTQQRAKAPEVEGVCRHGRVAVFEWDAGQSWRKAGEGCAHEEAAKTRAGLGGEDGFEHLGEADGREGGPELVGSAGNAALPALHAQAVVEAIHLRGVRKARDRSSRAASHGGHVGGQVKLRGWCEDGFVVANGGEALARHHGDVERLALRQFGPEQFPPVAAGEFAERAVEAHAVCGAEAAMGGEDPRVVEGVVFAVGHAQRGVELFGRGDGFRWYVLVLQAEFGGNAGGDGDVRVACRAGYRGGEGVCRLDQAGEQEARIVATGKVGDQRLGGRWQGFEDGDERVVGLFDGFGKVEAFGPDCGKLPVGFGLRACAVDGEHGGRADLADALPQAAVFVEDAGGDEFVDAHGVELRIAQLGEHGGREADGDAVAQLAPIDMDAAAAVGDDMHLPLALVDDDEDEEALQLPRQPFCPVGEVLFDQPGRIAPRRGRQGQPGAEIGDPHLAVGGTGDAFVGSLGGRRNREGGRGGGGGVGNLYALEVAQRTHAFVEARGFSLAGSGNEQEGVAHGGRLYGVHARWQACFAVSAVPPAPSLRGLPA